MAITFNTTVGDPAANSYATVDEADDYLTLARLHVDANWTGLTEKQKQAALMWAAREIDLLEFVGSLVDKTQALQWPRTGAYAHDGRLVGEDEIPAAVKNAQAELAYFLAQADPAGIPAGEEFERVKVGPIEIDFKDQPGEGEILEQAPPDVRAMLKRYLNARGIRIPLVRG
jgi:hypothetical protein